MLNMPSAKISISSTSFFLDYESVALNILISQ